MLEYQPENRIFVDYPSALNTNYCGKLLVERFTNLPTNQSVTTERYFQCAEIKGNELFQLSLFRYQEIKCFGKSSSYSNMVLF